MATDINLKAQKLLQQNRFHEARQLYQKICKKNGDASSWQILGALNGMLGDPLAAETCARKVTSLQPRNPNAYFNLGMSLRDQRKVDEAIKAFQKAIELLPGYADAHNALGSTLVMKGNNINAEKSFLKAIELNPKLADAYSNLGNVLRTTGQYDEAINNYKKAINVQPQNIDAMRNLASLLGTLTRIEEATEWYKRIITLKPDIAEVHYELGNLLLGLDQVNDAAESFHRAQSLNPSFTEAIAAEAQALQTLGRFDESAALIQHALDNGHSCPAIIAALAEIAKRLGREDETIQLAESQLNNDKLTANEKQQLHFAAGKLYDALDKHENAFKHYKEANAQYRERYNKKEHERILSESKALFFPNYSTQLARASVTSDRPVFIVGMPRSGTSLVEQILASHPLIFGAGELNDISQYANIIQKETGSSSAYPACLGEATQSIFDNLAKQYLAKLEQLDNEARLVTDKMPHNFIHLGMISQILPATRIIHIQRNPLDTCLSIYFQQFNEIHAYAHDLEDLGHYYRFYEKMMIHWKNVLDVPILDIKYEDLASEPQTWIPRLIEFCGVEWDATCMEFHQTKRVINTPSNEQVRKPMYSSSIERWRPYETELGPLKTALEQE